MERREFIKKSLSIGAGSFGILSFKAPFLFSNTYNLPKLSSSIDIVKVENSSPGAMVQKAVELLGGISKFVKKGDTVVIKPNMSWARRPEQAANTNPEVIAEVIKLCRKAGAAKIKIFDNTCNEAKRCYSLSGIEKAAKKEGAEVSYIYKQKFKKVKIPQGKILKSWEFYSDALRADVYINVPIVKHHSIARVTMGLKNIMGVIGGERGKIHKQFDQKLADLNTVIRPELTILDATRILLRNGPQGGNINDVKITNTIIAGIDPVAIDSFGATLFEMEGKDLGYIQQAYNLGLGEIDLKKLKIETINLGG